MAEKKRKKQKWREEVERLEGEIKMDGEGRSRDKNEEYIKGKRRRRRRKQRRRGDEEELKMEEEDKGGGIRNK